MMRMLARLSVVLSAVSILGVMLPSLAQPKVEQTRNPAPAVAATAQQNTNVSRAQPTIEFVVPKTNETISNYPIRVQVKVTNFDLLPPVQYWREVSSSQDMSKGHIHYSFDDAPALATDETSLIIGANGSRNLPAGKHVLRAELRSMNHKALKPPVFAAISFTCQPSSQGAAKAVTSAADPRITKLRQQVEQLQKQVNALQNGGTDGLHIGKTAGEGNALVGKGKFPDAEAKYKEALALIPHHVAQKELSDKAAAILQAHVLTKMGILYTKKKDYPAAASKFAEATELFDANPVDSPVARKHQVECLRAYAELLRAENQSAKAKEMDARADKIKL